MVVHSSGPAKPHAILSYSLDISYRANNNMDFGLEFHAHPLTLRTCITIILCILSQPWPGKNAKRSLVPFCYGKRAHGQFPVTCIQNLLASTRRDHNPGETPSLGQPVCNALIHHPGRNIHLPAHQTKHLISFNVPSSIYSPV